MHTDVLLRLRMCACSHGWVHDEGQRCIDVMQNGRNRYVVEKVLDLRVIGLCQHFMIQLLSY